MSIPAPQVHKFNGVLLLMNHVGKHHILSGLLCYIGLNKVIHSDTLRESMAYRMKLCSA